jgi:hypothetical protein
VIDYRSFQSLFSEQIGKEWTKSSGYVILGIWDKDFHNKLVSLDILSDCCALSSGTVLFTSTAMFTPCHIGHDIGIRVIFIFPIT